MTQPHEAHDTSDGDEIVTTDPGAQQAPGQGEQSPEELGAPPQEDPDAEPGFA